jgi:hypothetical protein
MGEWEGFELMGGLCAEGLSWEGVVGMALANWGEKMLLLFNEEEEERGGLVWFGEEDPFEEGRVQRPDGGPLLVFVWGGGEWEGEGEDEKGEKAEVVVGVEEEDWWGRKGCGRKEAGGEGWGVVVLCRPFAFALEFTNGTGVWEWGVGEAWGV